MNRILSSMALAAIALLAWPAPARAAESYDNCTGFIDSLPATISSQGVWCLRKDLSTDMTSGVAITIATNNVTLDCNDFEIRGLAAGVATQTQGVEALLRANTTIMRCNIRGFHTGASLLGGSGHLVEDSQFESNTATGIAVAGTGSEIRNNQVLDTGGSSVSPYAHGISVGGDASAGQSGVDVIGNTISGVAPALANADGIGINSRSNGEGSIVGNRISGVVNTGTGKGNGIHNTGVGRVAIVRNHVLGVGINESVGIQCSGTFSDESTAQSTAHANVVQGFTFPIRHCFPTSNTVRN